MIEHDLSKVFTSYWDWDELFGYMESHEEFPIDDNIPESTIIKYKDNCYYYKKGNNWEKLK